MRLPRRSVSRSASTKRLVLRPNSRRSEQPGDRHLHERRGEDGDEEHTPARIGEEGSGECEGEQLARQRDQEEERRPQVAFLAVHQQVAGRIERQRPHREDERKMALRGIAQRYAEQHSDDEERRGEIRKDLELLERRARVRRDELELMLERARRRERRPRLQAALDGRRHRVEVGGILPHARVAGPRLGVEADLEDGAVRASGPTICWLYGR